MTKFRSDNDVVDVATFLRKFAKYTPPPPDRRCPICKGPLSLAYKDAPGSNVVDTIRFCPKCE